MIINKNQAKHYFRQKYLGNAKELTDWKGPMNEYITLAWEHYIIKLKLTKLKSYSKEHKQIEKELHQKLQEIPKKFYLKHEERIYKKYFK